MVESNHTVNPNDCTCFFFIPRFSRDVLGRRLCPVSRLADPSLGREESGRHFQKLVSYLSMPCIANV